MERLGQTRTHSFETFDLSGLKVRVCVRLRSSKQDMGHKAYHCQQVLQGTCMHLALGTLQSALQLLVEAKALLQS